MIKRSSCISLLAASVVAMQAHATCIYEVITAAKPDNIYQDLGNGSVLDLETGLIWARCPIGYSWNDQGTAANFRDDTCDDTTDPALLDWTAALQAAEDANLPPLFLGVDGWRLPSVKELASLVEPACSQPAMNPNFFPANSPSYHHWTSTPVTGQDRNAWTIDFAFGDVWTHSNPDAKGSTEVVRLVRGGP